ncbi:DNA damage-binding protein 1a [Dimargaris cristalligena]|nr:DNA damage-binding protein 1a [Dimargaris cristalligena]
MSHHYVVTAHKPASVHHALRGRFLAPNEDNLILGRPVTEATGDLSEIVGRPCDNGQLGLIDPDFRVAALHLYQGSIKIIPIETPGSLRMRGSGSGMGAALKRAHPHSQATLGLGRTSGGGGSLSSVYPYNPRYTDYSNASPKGKQPAVLSAQPGDLREAILVRIEELHVLSMTFLYQTSVPTLMVLYRDHTGVCHVKTYAVDLENAELAPGPWPTFRVENGANLLIPLVSGAVVIVGELTITYYHGPERIKMISMKPTHIEVYGKVDADDSRIMLGDDEGNLYILLLLPSTSSGPEAMGATITRTDGSSGDLPNLKLERLGNTAIASALVYLQDDFLFIGSHYGDSQLVDLAVQAVTPGQYLQVVETFPNLAPITDFCVVDVDKQGQGQMVTCSGAYSTGSLRVIRNGIGIHPQLAMPIPGVKHVWSIRPRFDSSNEILLVLGFATETKLLTLVGREIKGGEPDQVACLREVHNLPGFARDEPTLGAYTIRGDLLIQVTETCVRLIRLPTKGLETEWRPSGGARIQTVSANSTQILLAVEDRWLVYLTVEGTDNSGGSSGNGQGDSKPRLVEQQRRRFDADIACLSVVASQYSGSREIRLAAVGFWSDATVRVIKLPTLEDACVQWLGSSSQAHRTPPSLNARLDTTSAIGHGNTSMNTGGATPSLNQRTPPPPPLQPGDPIVMPRSLTLIEMEKILYLMVALGDGHLYHFKCHRITGELRDRKKVSLGNRPLRLSHFYSVVESERGVRITEPHVFVSGDKPTIIHSSGCKLSFANVNEPAVYDMCSFRSHILPKSIVLVDDSGVRVGHIDDIQKLHIRTVPLPGYMARRICYQEANWVFGVLTSLVPGADTPQVGGLDDSSGMVVEGRSDAVTSAFNVIDSQTFQLADSFHLRPYEQAESILSRQFPHDKADYFIVGTAFIYPNTNDTTEGRLLVLRFASEQRKIELVCELTVPGAVYSLAALTATGHLAATVNNRTVVYEWLANEVGGGSGSHGGSPLREVCAYYSHVLALSLDTQGPLLAVGDLMRSITLLKFDAQARTLTEVARDYHTNWMTALASLDDVGREYLGAEISYNLFTVRREGGNLSSYASSSSSSSHATEGDHHNPRLETTGQFHLGDFVNRFRPGALVMNLPDSHPVARPQLLYGTVNGAIGVVASLTAERFDLLQRLQTNLTRVIQPVGGLPHDRWRAFTNTQRSVPAEGFIDGDLVEQFLDLDNTEMQAVVSGAHGGTPLDLTVDELTRMVEDLTNIY